MKFKWFVLLAALMGCFCHDGKSQTVSGPSTSGGQIFQLAGQYGISWVDPAAAQNIVSTKAALNWKSLGFKFLSDATLFTAFGGIAKIITIPLQVSEGLMIAHGVSDETLLPILQTASPNPNAVAPLLTMTTVIQPTSLLCSGNTFFASMIQGQSPATIVSMAKKKASQRSQSTVLTVGPVLFQGMMISFTPQPVVVARRIDGTTIKQFIPVSMIACLPMTIPVATIVPAGERAPGDAVLHINPDAVADGTLELRAALHVANKMARQEPDNPMWIHVQANLLRQLDQVKLAQTLDRIADGMPQKLVAPDAEFKIDSMSAR